MKASDVFREREFLFGRKAPFHEAFPDIEDFDIEVTEDGRDMIGRGPRRRVYRKSDPPGEFVDCSNPSCYDGGVSIGSLLRTMVFTRETEHQSNHICQGYEGSPKGRRRYRSCLNRFEVKITLTYK